MVIMALRAVEIMLVVLAVSRCGMVRAQGGNFRVFGGLGMEDDVQEYMTFTDAERLEFAARSGESRIVQITGGDQIATAQEASNINIDCLPWLLQFPGGSIQWSRQQLGENGEPLGDFMDLTPSVDPMPTDPLIVGGEFNRWANITGVVIAQGARDPDRAIFRCEVCIARGTPFESCYAANYTNLVVGAPPRLSTTSRNICIEPGEEFNLNCAIIENEIPRPLPVPVRTWTNDDIVIYSVTAGDPIEMAQFIASNPIFTPGLFDPDVLVTPADGSIQYRTMFENVTSPAILQMAGFTLAEAMAELVRFGLGTWTCTTGNNLGNATIRSVIRRCGPLPVIPDCRASVPGGVVFPDSGTVLNPGCDICIQEGARVTLDCTVTSGDPPITYTWTNGTEDVVLAETPRLTVTMPGTYSCTVENLDERTDTVASVLLFSPRATLDVGIEGRTTSGCERLDLTMQERLNLGADICVFVGETLNVDCTTDDEMADLRLLANNMMMENTTLSFVVPANAIDVQYGCQIASAEGSCGTFQLTSMVRVYDPARISRTSVIPDDHIGVGRPPNVVQRDSDSTVVLRCPTSGIPEETTTWARVVEDSTGCFVETLIENLPDDQRLRYDVQTTEEESTLTISSLTFVDEGTYVCRTRNIAGNDADIVSLIIDEGSPEFIVSEVTECDMMCAEGIRNQSFICRNSRFLITIPNFICDDALVPQPPISVSCQAEFPNVCLNVPVWIPYPWSKCSLSCNQGHRRRDVLCQIPMTGEVLPHHNCNYLTRPRTVEACGPNTCCVEDQYPFYCKQQGAGYCNLINYQKLCCWTCGLTELP